MSDDSIPYGVPNPLATEPKREKKGSETYRKYNYQYHWAFCRLLDEHKKGNEYALFIEEHEDVTVSDSLDATEARFEFNQVKETATKFTLNALLQKKKGNGSILGKLALDTTSKSFGSKIKEARLVSSRGFTFNGNSSGFDFELIRAGDLSAKEVSHIRAHLKNEVGDDALVDKLLFVVADLQPKDFENAVKGRISDLIEVCSSGNQGNAVSIYRCVITDLQRKGENTFDYKEWDQALKKKAVTSEQIQKIINQNVSRKDDEQVLSELRAILQDEFSLSSVQRKNIQRAFQRYYEKRFGDRSLGLTSISNEIREQVVQHESSCKDARDVVDKVRESLTTKCRDYFDSADDLSAAILYEFITDKR